MNGMPFIAALTLESEELCKNLALETQISEHDAATSLCKFKPNKAAGPACLLKECANQSKGVFAHLFHYLIHSRTVPKAWEFSITSPVPLLLHLMNLGLLP